MKKVSRPRQHRIRRILELIHEGGRSGRLPNARHFCRELAVSRPTVMRDLECLRMEEGAPIEYVGDCHGYRLTNPTWDLPPMKVTRQEVFAFCLARKMLDAFRGTPLEIDLRSVLGKIEESVSGVMSLNLDAATDRVSVLGEDYVPQDPARWMAMVKAIEHSAAVDVDYRKFNGDKRRYGLEPLHLVFHHGDWYVLCREQPGERMMTLPLSRMEVIREAGRTFKRPSGWTAKKHLADAFGITSGEKMLDVRLRFSANVATYIRSRIWHASQKLMDRKDGSVDVCLRTAGWKELVRWVLSWQPDVQVLAPATLRERVLEKLRQGLEKKG